jgi:hypothetical protein
MPRAGYGVKKVAKPGGWKDAASVLTFYAHALDDPTLTDAFLGTNLIQDATKNTATSGIKIIKSARSKPFLVERCPTAGVEETLRQGQDGKASQRITGGKLSRRSHHDQKLDRSKGPQSAVSWPGDLACCIANAGWCRCPPVRDLSIMA